MNEKASGPRSWLLGWPCGRQEQPRFLPRTTLQEQREQLPLGSIGGWSQCAKSLMSGRAF